MLDVVVPALWDNSGDGHCLRKGELLQQKERARLSDAWTKGHVTSSLPFLPPLNKGPW
jgi:hypothetical protein